MQGSLKKSIRTHRNRGHASKRLPKFPDFRLSLGLASLSRLEHRDGLLTGNGVRDVAESGGVHNLLLHAQNEIKHGLKLESSNLDVPETCQRQASREASSSTLRTSPRRRY